MRFAITFTFILGAAAPFVAAVPTGNATATSALGVGARGEHSFQRSCDNIRFDPSDPVLYAECEGNGDGKVFSSALNLNRCIGNSDGQLSCGVQDYEQSCSNCRGNENRVCPMCLICDCRKNDGEIVFGSFININDCVGNAFGTLAC